ncbi:MAG: hypothetical protein ACREJB_00360 [Planctomycetaceae bacterium]
MRTEYLIRCKIERGGFNSERTFEIELPDGCKLVGVAFVEHLLDENKGPLDEDTPGYGEQIEGFVKCRRIRQIDEQKVLIEVPSSDVIHVPNDELLPLNE